jgi:hypothetical protein
MRSVVKLGALAEKSLAKQAAGMTEERHGSSDHNLLTHDWADHSRFPLVTLPYCVRF